MSTLFLALQCSQCSTMQVKQKKKSSNKWVCVVCNLKQSVLKVFARGPMARDLRKFVQEFNMSRMESENPGNCSSNGSDLSRSVSDGSCDATSADDKKKRMDWSEYLETEDDKTGDKDNECGVEIITEMPPKKPKITCSKYQPKIYENKSFHKNITKRKRNYEDKKEASNKNSVITNGRSRWSEYLDSTGEEQEKCTGDDYIGTDLDASEKPLNEFLVQDEVHPDFL